MMDFEQRKQEILRRSRQRIQKRRTLRHAIMTCVPVVVCVAAFWFWGSYGGFKADNRSQENMELADQVEDGVSGQTVGATGQVVKPVSVQVQSINGERVYTQEAVLILLEKILQQPAVQAVEPMDTGGYLLRVTDSCGQVEDCILVDGCLTGYGRTVQLSQIQQEVLCRLLELNP